MIELLQLYQWTIVCGIAAAISLALVGCQVAARDKAMQTLCLGQGSMFGVLLGIGLLDLPHHESELVGHAGPFAGAALCAMLVVLAGEFITQHKQASKNSYFTALFAFLLSLNYLMSAVFPSLEAHVSQVFFGDLATLTHFDVWATGIFSALVLAMMLVGSHLITNHSFEVTTFGSQTPGRLNSTFVLVSNGVMFLFICFAIQFLGFLFAIACLFLPTTLLSLSPKPGLRRHLIAAGGLAGLGTLIGFIGSLYNPRLPTVPTIVSVLVVLGLAVSALGSRLGGRSS